MTEYTNLTEIELQAVIDKAENVLNEKKIQRRNEVITQIEALAASIDVTVNIHDNAEKSVRKGKKVAAKYRNPANKSQAWTGRGVSPKWMKDLIEAGHDKSEFLI